MFDDLHSRPVKVERIIHRINKREPRLTSKTVESAIATCFFGRDIRGATSEELARLIGWGTTIHVVEELPVVWIHDPETFDVWVRDSGHEGLNEHRACEALIAYALRDIPNIELSRETDIAVWRHITHPGHEGHRRLREQIWDFCPIIRSCR